MVVVASNYGSQIHRTLPEHPVTFCGLPPARTHPAEIRWQDVDEHLRCVRCATDPQLLTYWKVLRRTGTLVEAPAATLVLRARARRVGGRRGYGARRRTSG